MQSKKNLRNKFNNLRKKKYYPVKKDFFKPLMKILKRKGKKKVSIYYPSNYEVDTYHLIRMLNKGKFSISLPKTMSNGIIKFVKWSLNDALMVNRYGFLEPLDTTEETLPEVIIVPLLAFDKSRNRLGYGKGYYDKFLNDYSKYKKSFITIGVAFSFQKYKKIPTTNSDVKLDFILTDKGVV